MQLSLNGKRWLKGLHVLISVVWIGAGISMLVLGFFKNSFTNGDELYAVNLCIKIIDDYIIIPAALGSLITGLLICWLTKWGFVKFYWVIVKWALTTLQILFGTFFLGPWVNGATAIADAERIMALQNATYLHYSQMNNYLGSAQVTLLVVLVFISVFKPWGQRKKYLQEK